MQTFCTALLYSLPDQRDHLRPLADWLDTQADELLKVLPRLAEATLTWDFGRIRSGEQVLKERGTTLPGWLQSGWAIEIAMRKERERILRTELD